MSNEYAKQILNALKAGNDRYVENLSSTKNAIITTNFG